MKKLLSVIMVLALCLSLGACSGGQPGKEELLADAIKTDMMTLQKAAVSNRLKAEQDYCNKPIMVSGKVNSIKEDYVRICDSQVSVRAYLSVDDMVKVESGETITVVGVISDIQDFDETIAGTTWSFASYIMDVAYLVEE